MYTEALASVNSFSQSKSFAYKKTTHEWMAMYVEVNDVKKSGTE
jgi:hypothetical protein